MFNIAFDYDTVATNFVLLYSTVTFQITRPGILFLNFTSKKLTGLLAEIRFKIDDKSVIHI